MKQFLNTINITILLIFCRTILFCQNVLIPISEIPDSLKKNANLIYQYKGTEVQIKSKSELEIKETDVFTVLNPKGDQLAHLIAHYSNSYKIKSIKVEIYNADNQLRKKYTEKDFEDYAYNPEYVFFSDDRAKYLNYIPISYPYSVKFEKFFKSENTAFIPSFFSVENYHVSIILSNYSLINKSNSKLRIKKVNNPIAPLIVTREDTLSGNYFYEVKNQIAIPEENLSPPIQNLVSMVDFSLNRFTYEGMEVDATSWNSLGNWMNLSLVEPTVQITDEIKKEVLDLKLEGSNYEKANKIYEYLQKKCRYVAVEIGIGGLKPMLSGDVQKKSFGDCKALTVYMKAMLKAAGIPSEYCIIYSSKFPKKFDPSFPKIGGNHAILSLIDNNNRIWLENTSSVIAFNHLGYSTLNRNVVALTPNGAQLIDTPKDRIENSNEIIDLDLKIDSSLLCSAKIQIRATGNRYDKYLALLNESNDELKKWAKRKFNGVNILEISEIYVKNDKLLGEIFVELTLSFKLKSQKIGNDILTRFNPSPLDGTQYLFKIPRILPIQVVNPYTETLNLNISLPKNIKVVDFQEKEFYSNEFASFSITSRLNESKLEFQKIFKQFSCHLQKEKAVELNLFFKKILSLDQLNMIFKIV